MHNEERRTHLKWSKWEEKNITKNKNKNKNIVHSIQRAPLRWLLMNGWEIEPEGEKKSGRKTKNFVEGGGARRVRNRAELLGLMEKKGALNLEIYHPSATTPFPKTSSLLG